MSRVLCAWLLTLFLPLSVVAAEFEITILTSDSEDRQHDGRSFAGIVVQPHRPVLRAVELAVFESEALLKTLGMSARVDVHELDANAELLPQLQRVPASSLVILDLPLDVMERVVEPANELGLVTFNVRHSDAYLREEVCLPGLFHTIPSDNMYFDALGQFLVHRGWRRVLLVRGASERDQQRAATLVRSIRKFGASVVEERVFTLSHHPDDRDRNQPDFLTGGVSYDVVAVIDSNKDYGRYLQYSTRSPRPVVGDIGLEPRSWHFALERYGAPQLNERYRQFKSDAVIAEPATMTDAEFAAWAAVKLVSNSLTARVENETGGIATFNLSELLNDPDTQVDLYKGTRGSVRQWNNQLRQPVLLATSDAVIAIAPMPKFLHPKHYVDTLGLDEPESSCQLR